MALLVNSGRVAVAQMIVATPLWVCWGSGLTAWDTTPVNPSVSDIALVTPFGWREVNLVSHCTPNVGGDIHVASGNYELTATPTRYVYLRGGFELTDSPAETVREVGIFMNTTLTVGLPPEQTYFSPADIASAGTMIGVDRFPAIARNNTFRQIFEFVLTF